MGLNQTPASERVHIGFFGKRNAGKSSVMNAVTGQDLAVVSAVKGTTTDPVYKAMELLPLGPVMMMDTPGIDDEGELGFLRIKKSWQVLNKTDFAVMVIDAKEGITKADLEFLQQIQKKQLPFVIVLNKEDCISKEEKQQTEAALLSAQVPKEALFWVSAAKKTGICELKERLARFEPEEEKKPIVGDLLSPKDLAVLVVPIDKAAPKGRLILPQQQTIRDILDTGAAAVVVRDLEFKETLKKLGKNPALVITDSQVFSQISRETPEEIPLTSFSILFARYKGILFPAVEGAKTLEKLSDGDKILISEGCTHHRQCGDIGTEKLPAWIKKYTGKEFAFSFTSGTEFPENLQEYSLIVHCGGCMLNEREMKYRLNCAGDQHIPMTNYGILIAYMNGILERSIKMLSERKNK